MTLSLGHLIWTVILHQNILYVDPWTKISRILKFANNEHAIDLIALLGQSLTLINGP